MIQPHCGSVVIVSSLAIQMILEHIPHSYSSFVARLDRDLNSAQQKLHLNHFPKIFSMVFSMVFFHRIMEFEWGPVPVRAKNRFDSLDQVENLVLEKVKATADSLDESIEELRAEMDRTRLANSAGGCRLILTLWQKANWWHSVENFVDLQESKMKKDFETFNLKASKDIKLPFIFLTSLEEGKMGKLMLPKLGSLEGLRGKEPNHG